MLPELIVVIIVATLNFTKVNDQESYLELFSLFKRITKERQNKFERETYRYWVLHLVKLKKT